MTKIRFDKTLLAKQLKAEIEQQFKLKLNHLLEDLKTATPVDTGLARDSWKIRIIGDTEAVLENEQEYIISLNNGSSQQAPRNFIETAILNNGFKLSKNIIQK